jgi:Tfp pilus assembly protein FimT
LLVSVAFTTVLVGMALPIGVDAIDDLHTASAARFLAARIAANRMDAISRSRAIGVRFQPATPDYQFAAFADGNGNGVRTAEITAGIDSPVGKSRQLSDDFPRVRFGLAIGSPDVDGVRNTSADGVRIGTPRILTVSPDGTATSGTLYVQGRRAQYAVRVLGATGRTRVLKYDAGARAWISR